MTLAQFKRDAAAGKFGLEIIRRYDQTAEDLPEHMKGIRAIIHVNSVGITLQGRGSAICSELNIRSAKLFECDGEKLTIYAAGYRDPTEEEQTLLEEWDRQEQAYLKVWPCSDTYWKQRVFFRDSKYPYMSGFDYLKCRGCLYNPALKKVRDNKVRGDVILEYRVHWYN